MATEDEIRALKKRYSFELLKNRAVSGVGVERDENGEYVLTVHLSDDAFDLPSELEGLPVRYVRGGPFEKQ